MDVLGWTSARPLTLQSLIDCHLGVCGAKRGCYDTSTVLRKRAERNEANSTLPHDLRNATPFPCVYSVSSHLFYQLVVLPSWFFHEEDENFRISRAAKHLFSVLKVLLPGAASETLLVSVPFQHVLLRSQEIILGSHWLIHRGFRTARLPDWAPDGGGRAQSVWRTQEIQHVTALGFEIPRCSTLEYQIEQQILPRVCTTPFFVNNLEP